MASIIESGWLTKNNTPTAQEKCISRLLFYHFSVNLPLMIVSYPVFRFMVYHCHPGIFRKVVLTQIIFYFILEDFVFYIQNGCTSMYTASITTKLEVRTLDTLHQNMLTLPRYCSLASPQLLALHLITLWLWMVLRVVETVEAHCGYHFPWSLSNFLPLYGGSDFHDYHHRLLYTKSGNYSSTFVYMDWIFGTDKGYRKLKALKHNGVEDERKQT